MFIVKVRCDKDNLAQLIYHVHQVGVELLTVDVEAETVPIKVSNRRNRTPSSSLARRGSKRIGNREYADMLDGYYKDKKSFEELAAIHERTVSAVERQIHNHESGDDEENRGWYTRGEEPPDDGVKNWPIRER